MQNKSRYVFDTNVIVSALLFSQSTSGRSLKIALNQGALLLSEAVAEELGEVLRRDRFDRYVKRETREEFLQSLIQSATFIEIIAHIEICRDPKDDQYLELAVNGKADCIISGDADLIVLSPFRGIDILPPHEFLMTLGPK
ncbi:MAG: putative toxin-antitoxin system toxin component, PIN family [Gemmatimonadota bacterium]|nr:putative toxin-antitoxin system toxin component, PIN family [Gemmatimonadota bacterium]